MNLVKKCDNFKVIHGQKKIDSRRTKIRPNFSSQNDSIFLVGALREKIESF